VQSAAHKPLNPLTLDNQGDHIMNSITGVAR
jgi:hypothetical protein